MSGPTNVADLEADPAVRVGGFDWPALADEVNECGMARTEQLLSAAECRSISALYDQADLFRSTIDMARYRFGSGQYRYFDGPFPALVAQLRTAFYPNLPRSKPQKLIIGTG